MPYDMIESAGRWCVRKVDASGAAIETMKCYDEREPALAYLRALEINVMGAERSFEKALAELLDRQKDAQYVWVGISTTGMKDKLGDIIPSVLTRVDIEQQAHAIRAGEPRPNFEYWNSATRERVHEHAINSPVFQDFGALLVQHDLTRMVGRRILRVAAEDYTCFEAGWCSSEFRPATMSIGYRYATTDEQVAYPVNYLAVYSYEASVTRKGTEANPYTVFACEPSKLKRDAVAQIVWDNFGAAMLGRNMP